MIHESTESQGSLLVVVGMPGAGKTTYLKQQLAAGEIDSFYDDYQKGAPEEDRSNPRLSPNFAALSADLSNRRRVAIADIRYCIQEEIDLLVDTMRQDFPETTLDLVYFANDPEACKHNVRRRGRAEHIETEIAFIDTHSQTYKPPTNQTITVIIG